MNSFLMSLMISKSFMNFFQPYLFPHNCCSFISIFAHFPHFYLYTIVSMTCFSSLPLLYLFLDDFPHTFSPAISSVILNSFDAFTEPFSLVDFFHLTYFGIILSPVIPDRFWHGSVKRTLPLSIFTIVHKVVTFLIFVLVSCC
jgi:hypothetical protein